MRSTARLLVSLSFVVVAAMPLAAQGSRAVHGTVRSAWDSVPLPDVVVRLLGAPAGALTTTSAAGTFTLELPPGPARLLAARIGFTPDTVALAAGRTDVTIWLRPTVVELDTLAVTGRADELIGIASSASQGHVGSADLREPPARPRGRAARERARCDRDPALRRRQGQPVLHPRLQPRPRYRLPDPARGHAAEHGLARPRPGLHRSQLPHPRAGGLHRLPAGRVPHRAGRLRQRRRRRVPPGADPAAPVRQRDRRRGRAGARRRRRLGPGRRRRSAARRRGEALRRTVGPGGADQEGQRRGALLLGSWRLAVLGARHGLPQHLELQRPDPPARGRKRADRPLRQHRSHRRREYPALQPLGLVAPRRRPRGARGPGVRHLLRPQPVLQLRLLPRRHHPRRSVQPARAPGDPWRQRHPPPARAGVRPRAPAEAGPADPRRLRRRPRALPHGGPRASRHGQAGRRSRVGERCLPGGGIPLDARGSAASWACGAISTPSA